MSLIFLSKCLAGNCDFPLVIHFNTHPLAVHSVYMCARTPYSMFIMIVHMYIFISPKPSITHLQKGRMMDYKKCKMSA